MPPAADPAPSSVPRSGIPEFSLNLFGGQNVTHSSDRLRETSEMTAQTIFLTMVGFGMALIIPLAAVAG
ncbi:hypothetical protein P1J78_02080 [Psychromarinibacter sp. C21-152]|uniref:Uncharacterized protein n=1 Tax=Psychromarinibacter sediminicola TaxID=3033385 RepID=A0AAE3NKE4_9RHOB|nr:hypothetical protein [Psychromarinibacter sediminicola]MDF0599508.1 hypothetical protein [Psychromarinibacter sediminicola]